MSESMADDPVEALAGVQAEIIKARRLAAATTDLALRRQLLLLANEIEERARELDREVTSASGERLLFAVYEEGKFHIKPCLAARG